MNNLFDIKAITSLSVYPELFIKADKIYRTKRISNGMFKIFINNKKYMVTEGFIKRNFINE